MICTPISPVPWGKKRYACDHSSWYAIRLSLVMGAVAPIEKLGFFLEIVLRSSLQPNSTYFRIDDALRSVVFVGLVVSIYCYGKEKMIMMEKGDVLRSSDFLAFCSLTRLARMAVYSL